MKKITREDFEKIHNKPMGRHSKVEGVLKELKELSVWDGVIINREQWKVKTEPHGYIGQYFRQGRGDKRFKVKKMPDNTGWAVIRIQ